MTSDLIIENEILRVTFSRHGAELRSVWDKVTRTEYMWQADPVYWPRTSPVLFPIVGKVKDNQLNIDGKAYHMNQHGFARDLDFTCTSHHETEVTFCLTSNENTLIRFPYAFELLITYVLKGNCLTCRWEVRNTTFDTMYFAIGAHPGFNVLNGNMSEYELYVEGHTEVQRLKLDAGLITAASEVLTLKNSTLQLHDSIFTSDAIVIPAHAINKVCLRQQLGSHSITLSWDNFSYLGIWAPKNCTSFVCIEPWCGIADSVDGHVDIRTKNAMCSLEANEVFTRNYTMTFNS